MKLRIWAALISIYIVWGSTYLAIRFAVQSMPPFLMAATRFLVAGAVMYAWRRLAGDGRPTRREWRATAVIGLFLLLGGNGGVVWAEQRVVSGVAALLIGSVPIWLVLLDAIRPGGQRPNWQTVLGILVGFIGIAWLISPTDLSGGAAQTDMPGILALLLGALFWAIGSLYGRNAALPASPMLATGMEMLVGGAGLLAAGTITGEWSRLDLAAIQPESALGLVYLILFGSLVGFASYTWLLRVAPISLVATYAYVNPLVAILLGNLLAQEPLTPRVVLSAILIVGAIVLINTGRAAMQKRLSMGANTSAVISSAKK